MQKAVNALESSTAFCEFPVRAGFRAQAADVFGRCVSPTASTSCSLETFRSLSSSYYSYSFYHTLPNRINLILWRHSPSFPGGRQQRSAGSIHRRGTTGGDINWVVFSVSRPCRDGPAGRLYGARPPWGHVAGTAWIYRLDPRRRPECELTRRSRPAANRQELRPRYPQGGVWKPEAAGENLTGFCTPCARVSSDRESA